MITEKANDKKESSVYWYDFKTDCISEISNIPNTCFLNSIKLLFFYASLTFEIRVLILHPTLGRPNSAYKGLAKLSMLCVTQVPLLKSNAPCLFSYRIIIIIFNSGFC